MKNKYNAINLLILSGLMLIFLFLGLIHYVSTSTPLYTDLESHTGTILEYHQYDEKWYDDILGSAKGSYFGVRLEDDSYFEATGATYANIDRKLFEEIREGEEITITYFRQDGGLRKICSIEYKDQTYLSLEKVLAAYEQSDKFTRNMQQIIFVLSISTAILLYVINYVKYRKYIKKQK